MSKHGDKRKADILAVGLTLWRSTLAPPSARQIGKTLGVEHGAVLYHYRTAAGLHDAVAREAVRIGDAVIVPLLIASRHAAVADMTADARAEFMAGV